MTASRILTDAIELRQQWLDEIQIGDNYAYSQPFKIGRMDELKRDLADLRNRLGAIEAVMPGKAA